MYGDLPPVLPCPATRGVALRVHRALDADRLQVEGFIAQVFTDRYDAQVGPALRAAPNLVSVDSIDGRPTAAAGYRSAARTLFLEHYLSLPVEEAIASVAGIDLQRAEIVEVGHFASDRPGEGRRLLGLLGRYLAERGYKWVVSTATGELRRLFARLGIEPLVLGRADPSVLGPGAAAWGRYYDHAPLVLAGELRSNLARFERRR